MENEHQAISCRSYYHKDFMIYNLILPIWIKFAQIMELL
jgi:hypothetical protein